MNLNPVPTNWPRYGTANVITAAYRRSCRLEDLCDMRHVGVQSCMKTAFFLDLTEYTDVAVVSCVCVIYRRLYRDV